VGLTIGCREMLEDEDADEIVDEGVCTAVLVFVLI
jgi:hypothetical protein